MINCNKKIKKAVKSVFAFWICESRIIFQVFFCRSLCAGVSLHSLFLSLSQWPFIWESESARALERRRGVGCKGSSLPSPPGPCRSGTGLAWGGEGMRLPGPACWPVSAVLQSWGSRIKSHFPSWGVPTECGSRRGKRSTLHAPVGGPPRLQAHCIADL